LRKSSAGYRKVRKDKFGEEHRKQEDNAKVSTTHAQIRVSDKMRLLLDKCSAPDLGTKAADIAAYKAGAKQRAVASRKRARNRARGVSNEEEV
jgi:hypothetical protein